MGKEEVDANCVLPRSLIGNVVIKVKGRNVCTSKYISCCEQGAEGRHLVSMSSNSTGTLRI